MRDTPSAELEATQSALQARWLLLVVSTFDLVSIGVRVSLYSPFLRQPGAWGFLLEPVTLLLFYAGIILAATTRPTPGRLLALRVGAVIGMITGAMWVVNLALETFADLSGLMSVLSTVPFLFGAFILWGVAGWQGARRTGNSLLGVLSAVWGAMICVLITITFGLLLTYTSLPRLEQILANDPDFVRSHWSDLSAFAIANSLDSAFSHLLGALLIGAVVGTLGGLVGASIGQGARQHMRS